MRHPFHFPRKLAMLGFSLALILLWLALPWTALAEGTVIYVDKDAAGANNGASWTNAYTTLQAALAYAGANSGTPYEIWVAEGVYLPGATASATFTVPAGVELYGGFAGSETLRTQRNWTAHVTVLSGDIDENDSGKDGNGVVPSPAHIVGTNAYHVVWLDGETRDITGTTRLDGFTITAGSATSLVGQDRYGGGLYCNGTGSGNVCSPAIANVTFRANLAAWAGALFNYGSYGGASSPVLTNVAFISNTANFGGAVVNEGSGTVGSPGVSSPVLMNVTFSGNKAATQGCTLANFGTGGASNPTLTNVIIWGDCAADRIYNEAATPVVTYSLVEGGYGGTGNISGDPLFVDALAGNVDLQVGSPAIDVGTNAGAPTTDIRGWPRPYNYITDMGAYEKQPPPPILALTKQVTPTIDVPYNGIVTYTLILRNTGAATDMAVTLSDTLPVQVTFNGWVVNPGAVETNDAIAWSGTVTPATVITFTFTAIHTGGYGDVITNTAWFSGVAQAGNDAAAFTVVAEPPTAVNDAAGTHEGDPVVISVLANDLNPAGSMLTVITVTQGAMGSVTIGEGGQRVTYTSTVGSGLDSFTYGLEDIYGNSSAALVAVVVSPRIETDWAPQVAPTDPAISRTLPFTSTQADVSLLLPAGFYTETLGRTEIFFLAFTPVTTPTHTTPPSGLAFGDYVFTLGAYRNATALDPISFAAPITVTLVYSPAEFTGLKEETLGLYAWNGSAWSNSGIYLVGRFSAIQTLIYSLTHFTEYSILGEGTPTAAHLADVSTQVGPAGVTLFWRTADESNLLGFHLYRGDPAADPGVRLNEELIPAQGLGALGSFDYSFVDAVTLAPGASLVYWLETVDFAGTATRHGPFLTQALAAPAILTPRLYLPTVQYDDK